VLHHLEGFSGNNDPLALKNQPAKCTNPAPTTWAQSLERAPTVEALLLAPIGKYFVGPTFAYFYPEEHFTGLSLWGFPSADDIVTLNRLMDAVLAPAHQHHLSLIDTRGLEGVDPASFTTMARYVLKRSADFRALIRKQALLRPTGLIGAVVAGFYDVTPTGYPTAVFTQPESALCWLGLPEWRSAATLIDGLLEVGHRSDQLLERLRCHLETVRTERPCVEKVAAELGASVRTLQRRLRDANTTFRDEVRAAQVRVAQKLMLTTDWSLTAIAFESGCASLQHFSASFRELHGVAPSAWRASRRTA
jgi:AraC-like DNA-binding protein